jgi:eukaryotic-like serine/threonine-protein kinase
LGVNASEASRGVWPPVSWLERFSRPQGAAKPVAFQATEKRSRRQKRPRWPSSHGGDGLDRHARAIKVPPLDSGAALGPAPCANCFEHRSCCTFVIVDAVAEKEPAPVEPVGKYIPIAELGRGGMATAYLTSFSGPGGFNKLMVVKRLRPALAAEADFLRMFLDEARLAARIDHPNIVHTSEVGYDGANYFIAMEFVDGQPLENVIRRTKQQTARSDATPAEREAAPSIPLNLHLHVITKVLEGLDFAHELKDFDGSPLNVVHRDVSPHNVMVTYDGHVKLLDFGIAKAADSTTDTRTGFLKGKCAYMAPEQFGGEGVDRRADVFSVGIMLWQAVTGRRLWRGLSDTEIFGRLAKDEIPSPRTIVSDVDPKLEQICMKALATDSKKRYATASELQSALEDYIASKPELRASSRDLSRYVGELFKSERAKIHSLVESQVVKSKRSGEVMSLAEYFGNAAPSSSAQVATSSSVSSLEKAPSPITSEPPPRRSSVRLVFLSLAAAALIGVIAVAFANRRSASADVSNTAATSEAPSAKAQVTVRVQPPEAKVTIDGTPLGGSPPTGAFPLDNAQHQVHVEAAGFVAHSESLLLDSTRVTIDVALAREPVQAPPPPAASSATVVMGPKSKNSFPWHPGVRQTHPNPSPAPSAEPQATPVATPAPSATETSLWPRPNRSTGPVLDKTDPFASPTASPPQN